MRITKLHGLGNDFLVASPGGEPAVPEAGDLARRICDRHTGVGADGFIVLSPEAGDPARVGFRIFNADGSEAEISGNGLRCAAAFLAASGAVTSPKVLFRTAAGERPSEVLSSQGSSFEVRIGLGAPRLASTEIPFDDGRSHGRIVDYPLSVIQRTYPITCVSMGNPHCGLFFDHLPSRGRMARPRRRDRIAPVLPQQDERRIHPGHRPGRDRSSFLGARRRGNAGLRHRLGRGGRRLHAQGARRPLGQGPDGHGQPDGGVA